MTRPKRRPLAPTEQQLAEWRETAIKELQQGRCPDFALAPLTKIPPIALLPDAASDPNTCRERMKRLTLTLALAFNDLKDASWVLLQLGYGKPKAPEVSAYNGQWAGMQHFFLRLLFGFSHELVHVLGRNLDLIDAPEFLSVVQRIPREHRWAWTALLSVARREEDGKLHPMARLLKDLRNRVAFHYTPSRDRFPNNMLLLAQGYEEKFRSPTDPTAEHAFASLGANQEQTRFFFVDAALIKSRDRSMGDAKMEEVTEFFRDINYALRFLVQGLVEQLGGTDASGHQT